MTQDELAKKLGYKSRSSINKIETEAHNLTQSKIKLIADALQTTPSYIMGWQEVHVQDHAKQFSGSGDVSDKIVELMVERIPCTRDEDKLVNIYASMNHDGKGRLMEQAVMLYSVKKYQDTYPVLVAAHERTDTEITDEMIQNDMDLMDGDDWN